MQKCPYCFEENNSSKFICIKCWENMKIWRLKSSIKNTSIFLFILICLFPFLNGPGFLNEENQGSPLKIIIWVSAILLWFIFHLLFLKICFRKKALRSNVPKDYTLWFNNNYIKNLGEQAERKSSLPHGLLDMKNVQKILTFLKGKHYNKWWFRLSITLWIIVFFLFFIGNFDKIWRSSYYINPSKSQAGIGIWWRLAESEILTIDILGQSLLSWLLVFSLVFYSRFVFLWVRDWFQDTNSSDTI
jgi:hypothetical protein